MIAPRVCRLRIGIDLGGTKTEGILMDQSGEILARVRRATPQQEGYLAVLGNIQRLVQDLDRRAGAVCRVGIGTPGSISARTGLLKNSNTACLNGHPLEQDLAILLDRPVRIANDANCFALSEAIDGAGRGHAIVFGAILGTGVGGGIVVHGRLLAGAQHIAGEWGHNPLERDGPSCYCGQRGCVETLISGPGLERDYADFGTADAGTTMMGHAGSGGSPMDARTIIERTRAGDDRAEAAVRRYLERFGRALATVINILDPDAVILGGGLSNINRLYDEGRAQVEKHVFNDELRTLILRNIHGDSSGVRGAARLWPADDDVA
ncbi:MAG: ROK family protein [Acidiferrobacterales bacterium]